jgi:hypothetical protein
MFSAISLGEPEDMKSFYPLLALSHSFAALLLLFEISQLHSFSVLSFFTLLIMSSFLRTCFIVGGLLAVGSRAGPVVARDVEVYPLAARSRADPMVLRNIDVLPTIEERGFKSHVLGNHSLATSHVKDVLFNL